jgi:pimeloyl-ACP methyl ester carboxylesterase
MQFKSCLVLSLSLFWPAESVSAKSNTANLDTDPAAIHLSHVTYGNGTNMSYYHCGPSSVDTDSIELVLLHSKTSTKEDWKEPGILDDLCDGSMSVTALDLLSPDGTMLIIAFDALVQSSVLSGNPVVICTPGDSGASVIDLAELVSVDSMNELSRIVKAWIHVASPDVRSASESYLESLVTANIPVLSIHGDQDDMGRKATEKLVRTVNAKGVELQGGHRVYLFSPQEFVQEIDQFLEEKIESNTPSQAELIISTDTSTSSTITGFGKPSDDAMTINLSQVSYGISGDILPFYHCGPSLDSVTTELVLLHGSTGTKEHWKETGILDDLCNGIMSASALDFPPGADGFVLQSVFDALVQSSVLSGRPVVIVTPSASGTSVVTLAETNSTGLQSIVKAWIPVAPPAVLSASDSTIQLFPKFDIPVLSIHGDDDGLGRRVTEKLVNEIDAKGVELTGGHRVYLFSPKEFVQEIVDFLEEEGL